MGNQTNCQRLDKHLANCWKNTSTPNTQFQPTINYMYVYSVAYSLSLHMVGWVRFLVPVPMSPSFNYRLKITFIFAITTENDGKHLQALTKTPAAHRQCGGKRQTKEDMAMKYESKHVK